MANYLPESPIVAVFVVGFSFNIVQDIVVKHDVVKKCVFTRGVFFSNTILNLQRSGSLSSLSSNSLINSTTRALSIFPLSSGLVKNTFPFTLFGDGPITAFSFSL